MKKISILQTLVKASKSETSPLGIKIEIKNLNPRYTQLFHLANNGAILIGNKKLLMDELNCDEWAAVTIAREFNCWSRYAIDKKKKINWFLIRYHSFGRVPITTFNLFKELIQSRYRKIEYLQGDIIPQKVRRWKQYSQTSPNLTLVNK